MQIKIALFASYLDSRANIYLGQLRFVKSTILSFFETPCNMKDTKDVILNTFLKKRDWKASEFESVRMHFCSKLESLRI